MRPLGVVEPYPIFDHPFGLEPVLQFVQIDSFLFEGPPQPFDEDIVEISASTIHRDLDVGFGQIGDPGGPCELRPLIGIHDLGLAIFCDGLVQGFDAKAGVQRIRQPPR